MREPPVLDGAHSYTNPVYSQSFPDPFVLKFSGQYFAYCTGFAEDGNVFSVLRSADLVHWSQCGGAMRALEHSPPFYWAPEVTYDDGKFYLYYSVGNETLMEIRVAISNRPDGSFVDSGRRLTTEDFAIDPHLFIDDDQAKYLFYATDFLDHTHVGTGTVVDRLLDWFTLAGQPRPVTRARFDWQIYDPARKEKDGVRWHTVEGPTVLKRKGMYYEMFSGGNWKNETYGVSYSITADIDTPGEWKQISDGENVLPILRTIPGVVGPGHNSVVRGPNNRELYCVYHRWTDRGRVMAIDRIDFAGDRLFINGPTQIAQPAPFLPTIKSAPATVAGSFLCEFTAVCPGRFGLRLADSFVFTIDPTHNKAEIRLSPGNVTSSFEFPEFIDWTSDHLFRLELDHRRLRIGLDSVRIADIEIMHSGSELSTFSTDQPVTIKSFELTEGFVELFDIDRPLEIRGWLIEGGDDYHVGDGELQVFARRKFRLTKNFSADSIEAAVNFRLPEAQAGEFGISIFADTGEILRLAVICDARSIEIGDGLILTPLPIETELTQYHQLRIVKKGNLARCYFDDVLIASVEVADLRTSAAVFSNFARADIEMVRILSI